MSLNVEQLDIVYSYNYLGVIIDDGLTFDEFMKEKGDKEYNIAYYILMW